MSVILFKGKRVIPLGGYYSWFRVKHDLAKIVAIYRYALDCDVEDVGLSSYGYMQPETILLVKQEGNNGFIATVRYRFIARDNVAKNKFKLSFPQKDDIQLLTGKLGLQNTSDFYSPLPDTIALIVLDQRPTLINDLTTSSQRQYYYDLKACQMLENVSEFSELQAYLSRDAHV